MTTTNPAAAAAQVSLDTDRPQPRPAFGDPLLRPVTPLAETAPTLDTRALHAHFAAASVTDPHGGDFHRMVATVLARADRVTEIDGREWNRLLALLERHRHNPKASLNCGVLANLVGIAAFGDDADFETLVELGCLLGPERLAAVQHRAARFIEPDPSYPITTAALRRIVAASPHPVAGPLLDPAIALLLEGVDLDRFLPMVRTEAELIGVLDDGSVLEWRHHVAVLVAGPWSPYPRHLVDLAQQAERPLVAEVIGRITDVCRAHNRERERELVAEEVRRLVTDSCVTQRDFAHWIGTSPSRLSTYISGTVTPSASLMLRMGRASRVLRAREAPPAPPSNRDRPHLSAV